jgi:hypothetical protein
MLWHKNKLKKKRIKSGELNHKQKTVFVCASTKTIFFDENFLESLKPKPKFVNFFTYKYLRKCLISPATSN